MKEREVWDLTELPSNQKPITERWVFVKKSDSHIKAWFVIKGFIQVFGIDFEETFSLVARFKTVQLLLALATLEDWEIEELDMKTVFLFGDLDEEIYLTQPKGFIKKGHETLVCWLKKSLYGLKRAALQWNKALHKSVTEIGFTQTNSDPGVCLLW